MATFWEIAAHSPVNRMFSLYFVYDYFYVVFSHFGFEVGTGVLIAPASCHCSPLTLLCVLWIYGLAKHNLKRLFVHSLNCDLRFTSWWPSCPSGYFFMSVSVLFSPSVCLDDI